MLPTCSPGCQFERWPRLLLLRKRPVIVANPRVTPARITAGKGEPAQSPDLKAHRRHSVPHTSATGQSQIAFAWEPRRAGRGRVARRARPRDGRRAAIGEPTRQLQHEITNTAARYAPL